MERNYGLDLMRFVAIALVVVGHGKLMIASSPYFYTLMSTIDFLGVEIFFVLSGFLIGTVLLKDFLSRGVNCKTLRYFWVRRWWRTLPNYYLFLLINIVAFSLLKEGFIFDWSYLLFLQNFTSLTEGFFSVSWSLAVEEWFYLSLPLVALLLHFLTRRIKFTFALVILSFISLSILLRYQYVSLYDTAWNDEVRRLVILRLDSLVYGVLAAYWCFYWRDVFIKYANHSFLIGSVLLSVAMAIRFDQGVDQSILKRVILFPLISLSIMFYLPMLYKLRTRSYQFMMNSITKISIWSYSIYLLHVPLMEVFLILFKNQIGNALYIDLAIFIIWIALVILLSALVYTFYERPMTNLRDFNFKEKWSTFLKLRNA